MIYDTIIVGKGPAGITTAIYLKRYGYNPLVIAKDGGALEKVDLIENYYGFEKITGKDLMKNGVDQAIRLGIEIIDDEVLDLNFVSNYVITTKNSTFKSKTVVLACGTSRNRYAKADKLKKVSYCATCDGFFYRKKQVAIIGNGNYMAHELSVLDNLCEKVVVFTDGLPLEAEIRKDILVVTEKISDILGDEEFKGIKTASATYELDGCFVAIGKASGFTMAKHLGIALNNNAISVNKEFMTNLPGLFACGDAIGGLLQVSKAVGEGAMCATSIVNYLKGIK